MLSTKLKFSIDFVLISNHDRSSEFALSFASTESVSSFVSYAHESHKEISDKLAQNNANHELWADDRNLLKTFNVDDVKQLHACSAIHFKSWWNWTITLCHKSFYNCWYQFYFQCWIHSGLQRSWCYLTCRWAFPLAYFWEPLLFTTARCSIL